MQVEALVDSGAHTTFVNKSVVENNNLVTERLANPFRVINADGTQNKGGIIRDSMRAYTEIGSHKAKLSMLVTDLGTKQMIIGYTFLRRHNPEIDWQKGEWKFTRCPENCNNGARKMRVTQEEADALELPIEKDELWENLLDNIGEEDPSNPYINWLSTDTIEGQDVAEVFADHLEKGDEGFEDSEPDRDYRKYVPEHLWEFKDVFSKKKSERMPVRKPYDHEIDFEDGASMPKPAKLYPMSPKEKNSLDDWIDEEVRKGYIRPSKSPMAAPVFFVKKKDGSL